MKKLICIINALLIIMTAFSLNCFAEDQSINDNTLDTYSSVHEPMAGHTPIKSTGITPMATYDYQYVGTKRYWGVIRYYDYLCYKDMNNNWYMLTGLDLTMPMYHTKNSGSKSLSFTISQTYTSTTAGSFSTSIGGEAGVADTVKASVELGYGITNTIGRAFTASSTIQATIPASATTGYYKLHVCYNYHAMKIFQQRTDGTNALKQYICMPYGSPYAAVLYSASNADRSWQKW